MRRKKRTCRHSGCDEPMYMGGLCQAHHSEHVESDRRRERALDVLHHRVTDTPARADGPFTDDWRQLRRYWDLSCDVVNLQRGRRNMPLDEAQDALFWCISLATALLDAEDAAAHGQPSSYTLEDTRGWVVERFRNLEAGLMSNGLPRQAV